MKFRLEPAVHQDVRNFQSYTFRIQIMHDQDLVANQPAQHALHQYVSVNNHLLIRPNFQQQPLYYHKIMLYIATLDNQSTHDLPQINATK